MANEKSEVSTGMAETVGNHLTRVCEGILAGQYGLKLTRETHAELIDDLTAAVRDAKDRDANDAPITNKERAQRSFERSEVVAHLKTLTPEQRATLLAELGG